MIDETNNPAATSVKNRPSLKMVACPSCGTSSFIAADLKEFETMPCSKCGGLIMLTVKLRHFELRAPIASGGMGTVYNAWDTMLERTVAIKLMQPQLQEDQEALQGFFREARVVASLNHTNIIHVYSFDYWNDQLYLVMELADNGSLDSWIRKDETVPELNVLDVGLKMGHALNKALQHNILHRDIKPDNILFDSDGEAKLVDFGLAGSADEQDDSGEIWATPYYIAPEKVRREPETFLSDMYSLAGTLYHALTGHVPFEADDMDDVVAAHVHTPLTPPNHVNPAITQETSDAIYHAMQKDPAHRFQSYDEWIMALTAAHSQLMVKQYNITTH